MAHSAIHENLDSSDVCLVIDEGASDDRVDVYHKVTDENQNNENVVCLSSADDEDTGETANEVQDNKMGLDEEKVKYEEIFSENEDLDAYVDPKKFALLPGDVYKCKECDLCFDHLGSLKRHLPESCTSDQLTFTCTTCSVVFCYKSDYVRHELTHTITSNVQRCPQCDRPFITESHLRLHMKTHQGKKKYNCQLCDAAFVLEFNLTRHMHTHALGNFQCNICDKIFTFKANLDRHMIQHRQTTTHLSCFVCGSPAENFSKLRAHVTQHQREPCSCRECGKVLIGNQELIEHLEKCGLTSKTCPTKMNEGNDFFPNEMKNSEIPECSSQPASYNKSSIISKNCEEMIVEKITVDGGKELKKVTKAPGVKRLQKSLLKPELKCEICSKRFVNAGNLKRHMESKAGKPTYSCAECEEKFHEKGALKKHILIMHTDKFIENCKVHQCPICCKDFPSIGTLHTHMTNVHEFVTTQSETFLSVDYSSTKAETLQEAATIRRCPSCMKGFKDTKSLQDHVLQVHKFDSSARKDKMSHMLYPTPGDVDDMCDVSFEGESCGASGKDNDSETDLNKDSKSPIENQCSNNDITDPNIPENHILYGNDLIKGRHISIKPSQGSEKEDSNMDNISSEPGEYSNSEQLNKNLYTTCEPVNQDTEAMDLSTKSSKCFISKQNSQTTQKGNSIAAFDKENGLSKIDQYGALDLSMTAEQKSLLKQKAKERYKNKAPEQLSAYNTSLCNVQNSEMKKSTKEPACDITSSGQEYVMSPGPQNFSKPDNELTKCPNMATETNTLVTEKDSQSNDCRICNKVFEDKSLLLNHMKEHNDEKTHDCEYCSEKFITSEELRKHLSTHFKDFAHFCPYCLRMFCKEEEFDAHITEHSEDAPYMCNCCGYTFSSKQELDRHFSDNHVGMKPYQCQKCQRRFQYNAYLKSHMRSHLEEKPYKCQFCNRAFSQDIGLMKHVRVHSTEQPHLCKFCPQKFKLKSALIRHEAEHNEIYLEKSLRCTLCHKSFDDRGSLNKHLTWHAKQSVMTESGEPQTNYQRTLHTDKPKGSKKRKSMVTPSEAIPKEKGKKRRKTIHSVLTPENQDWISAVSPVPNQTASLEQQTITPEFMAQMQQMAMMQLNMQQALQGQTEQGKSQTASPNVTTYTPEQTAMLQQFGFGQGQDQENSALLMQQQMAFMQTMAMQCGKQVSLSDKYKDSYYLQLEMAYKQQMKLMEEYQHRLLDIENIGKESRKRSPSKSPNLTLEKQSDSETTDDRKLSANHDIPIQSEENSYHDNNLGKSQCGENGVNEIMQEETSSQDE